MLIPLLLDSVYNAYVHFWSDCNDVVRLSVCLSDVNILVNFCIKVLEFALQSGLTIFNGNRFLMDMHLNSSYSKWF